MLGRQAGHGQTENDPCGLAPLITEFLDEVCGDAEEAMLARLAKVTVDEIQQRVAAHYNIKLAEMSSPRRARSVARPAPVAVPSGGRGVTGLGRAQIGGHAVGLADPDARQHVHLDSDVSVEVVLNAHRNLGFT